MSGSRFALPLTEWAALRPSAWSAFLLCGLGLALFGALVGDEQAVQPLIITLGLAAAAAVLAGVRMHRPATPRPWRLLAICTASTVIGIALAPPTGAPSALGEVGGLVGDVLIGVGGLAGLAGFAMLIRGRIPGGDRAALLDAAILASGAGVLIWAVGLAPYVPAGGRDSFVAALFFYPCLVAMAMVVRTWFIDGAHRQATRLIVLFVVAANGTVIFDLVGGVVGLSLTGPYLVSRFALYAFMGAAALHPSMAVAVERQPADFRPIGRRRIVALMAALMVNPATLAIELATGRDADPAPYLIGGAVIGVLVIARLGDAMRQLGDSLRERESLMELLRLEALHDGLTALPNRSLFTERLALDFANRSTDRPLAVLLVDLDDFKAINDTFGHEAGDAVLVAIGERLRSVIRHGDMAARLGGDEFVVALPTCMDARDASRIAERVLETLSEPFMFDGVSLSVRASVGVAVADAEIRTADDLVRNADLAMYIAKSRGKGGIQVFDPSMQADVISQLELRTALAAGIVAGDLRLHYQPVVDLRTGHAVGFEALVRWMRDGKLVPPGDFIPIAEASGLIGPLTDWVIDEACRTTAGWGTSGHRPWVSVNLASSQVVRRDLVARIGRAIEATGLTPDRLVLEITESALLEIDVAKPALERLSQLGVRLAIDDFGVGYSALSYLARLPIDVLKIDRSFVAALHHEGPDEAIASAIITLAKRLGLTTIGEGIETSDQLDQLAALGCDLGQGYMLGRPAASHDLLHLSPSEDYRPRWRVPHAPAPLTNGGAV